MLQLSVLVMRFKDLSCSGFFTVISVRYSSECVQHHYFQLPLPCIGLTTSAHYAKERLKLTEKRPFLSMGRPLGCYL